MLSRAGFFLGLALSLFFLIKIYGVSPLISLETAPELYDWGWFSYLFGQADPSLKNPWSVDSLSYYNYHVAPLIFLWSWPTVVFFGLTGGESFILFHLCGAVMVFAAFFVVESRSWFAFSLAGLFVLAQEKLLDAALTPHIEIMYLGLCAMIYAVLMRNARLAVLPLIIAVSLLREDGGFLAAYTIILFSVLNWEHLAAQDRLSLGGLAGIGVAGSFAALAFKKKYFDEVSLVGELFVGDGFAHLTPDFMAGRILDFATSSGSGGLVIWVAVMVVVKLLAKTTMSWRVILAPTLLLSPYLLFYMTAISDAVGNFNLYYGLAISLVVLLTLLDLLSAKPNLDAGLGNRLSAAALGLLTSCIFPVPFGDVDHVERYAIHLAAWPDFSLAEYDIRLADAYAKPEICGSRLVLSIKPEAFTAAQIFDPIETAYGFDTEPLATCSQFYLLEGESEHYLAKLDTHGFQLHSQVSHLQLYQKE